MCVTAACGRLPPLLIFKAKSGGKIEKELSIDNNILNKKCYIACIDNAWPTELLMKKCYKDIWINYIINDEPFNNEGLGYLILDKASTYFHENILNYNVNYKANIDITYIPSSMT